MHRDRLGQGTHPTLGSAVRGKVRLADDAVDGGKVDNRSAAGFLHQPDAFLTAEEDPVEIDRHGPPPFGERGVLDVLGDGDAGIVDQHIESPEALLDGGHDGGPVLRFRDVVTKRQCLAARLGDLRRRVAGQAFIDVGDDQPGAFRCKQQRRRPPEAESGPRNERCLAFDAAHRRHQPPLLAGSSGLPSQSR